jgi:hypothetical protein
MTARELLGVGASLRWAVAPQHFAEFRSWAWHGGTPYAAGDSNPSRGLWTVSPS